MSAPKHTTWEYAYHWRDEEDCYIAYSTGKLTPHLKTGHDTITLTAPTSSLARVKKAIRDGTGRTPFNINPVT